MPKPKINVECVEGVRLQRIKPPSRPGGPLPDRPYGVMWDNPGGTPLRPSSFFESIELLERKVIALNEAKRKNRITLVPTSDELAEWRAFKKKIGAASPLEVYAGWAAYREKSGLVVCNKTVPEAVDEYLALEKKRMGTGDKDPETKRRKNQTLDDNSFRQKRCKLERFKAEFALAKLDEPTTPEIEDWVDGLEMVIASDSWNDHIKQVRSLYYHFAKLVPHNPAAAIERRDDMKSRTRVMPVVDIAKLLVYTMTNRPWLMPRLATEVFCGLRFTGAAKLPKDSIRLDTRTLILPRWLMKTKSDHKLQCVPENYWEWAAIGHGDEKCWQMSPIDYMHAKSSIFEDSGVVNPGNGLRHTMPSRHVAAYNDPGLIARILCHKNQQKLWDTYLGISSQEDGEQHFRLLPGNAARAAAGEHLPDPHKGKIKVKRSHRSPR